MTDWRRVIGESVGKPVHLCSLIIEDEKDERDDDHRRHCANDAQQQQHARVAAAAAAAFVVDVRMTLEVVDGRLLFAARR